MKTLYTFLFLIFSFSAIAQSDRPDSLEIQERLSEISRILHQSERSTNNWWYGWLGLYSAATVGQGVVYFTSEQKTVREDMVLGAATTALGAIFQVMTPILPGKDADLIDKMPESNYGESLLKLRSAEDVLKSNAEKEKVGRSWQIHALTTAVNLGSGLITWLGYKRSVWDGAVNFLMNEAITEIQIWTQPSRLTKEYNAYELKYIEKHHSGFTEFQPEIQLGAYAGGVSVRITF